MKINIHQFCLGGDRMRYFENAADKMDTIW